MSLDLIIKKFADKKILVIGDIMLDHYIWGDVERISPEAPVPVVHVQRDTYTAGGAANVALNLANLGISTSVLGYCSSDEAGMQLKAILDANNIKLISLSDNASVPTIIKTRVITRGQQLCRIDREDAPVKYQLSESDFKLMKGLLNDLDAIIISDYAKGIIGQSLVNWLLTSSQFKNGKLFIAVDPKPSNKISYNGIGLLTPNKLEALQLAGLNLANNREEYPLEEVCRKIHEKYNPETLVITLGADGMAVCKQGRVVAKLKTEARQVFDVSGAGDTVIAVLAASLANEKSASEVEAATLANIAAGCVVSHIGTAPITLPELLDAVDKTQKNELAF